MQKERIGAIGLGIMGGAMAAHILKAGFPLGVWARNPTHCQPLIERGAQVYETPRKLGAAVDVLCVTVTDGAGVREVLFGDDGAVLTLRSGALVIIFSTVDPTEVQELAVQLALRGIALVDAPVTGGDVGARQGSLTVMAGGDTESVARLRMVANCFSKRIEHVGPVGSGQLLKAANQIGVAIGIAAMTEALSFATRAGIDPALAVDLLSGGAAGSWAFQNYAPRVLAGNDLPGFKAEDMLKDLKIALSAAEERELSLPVTELVRRAFEDLVTRYPHQLGNHALHRLYGGFFNGEQNEKKL